MTTVLNELRTPYFLIPSKSLPKKIFKRLSKHLSVPSSRYLVQQHFKTSMTAYSGPFYIISLAPFTNLASQQRYH
jgi:hypothetical protein